jgi:hypothetical protein
MVVSPDQLVDPTAAIAGDLGDLLRSTPLSEQPKDLIVAAFDAIGGLTVALF